MDMLRSLFKGGRAVAVPARPAHSPLRVPQTAILHVAAARDGDDNTPTTTTPDVCATAGAADAASSGEVAARVDLADYARQVLAAAKLDTPEVRKSMAYEGHTDDLAEFSALGSCVTNREDAIRIIDEVLQSDHRASRAIGAMVGMAVADSVGHFFEFLPVVDVPFSSGSGFKLATLTYTKTYNKFGLQEGQWTDDTAMGLCLADSLLSTWRNHGNGTDFDGSDVRARFHAWWYHGLNNAFAEDDRRGIKVSVGLGGNVSMSLRCLKPGVMPPPVFERDTDDAGNGSLMRLAPVPVRFWANPRKAREIAAQQSYSTHPGPIAACCCEFLAFATARAIAAPDGLVGGDGGVHVVEWLDATVAAFVADIDAEGLSGPGWDELRRLLASQEPPDSLERNWNWRARSLDICNTLARRGRTYNGHPVIPEYYGAFSMDGLALALFCVHHTKSFDDAVERCVNFLGDADSTGSMVGQLAGAIYGMDAIDHRLVEKMLLWDSKAIIPLRAAILFATGTSHDES